jgi:hypothetical protein
MILDSLRYWVTEMHVDGFRFDLASALTRDTDGEILGADVPLLTAIRTDPVLCRTRLIAEPWDAGGAFQLGIHFPGSLWHQWNGRFRDDVRRFVRGDPGMVPALMQRLYGSDDLFPTTRTTPDGPTRASTTSPATTASPCTTSSRTTSATTWRTATTTPTACMRTGAGTAATKGMRGWVMG